jgi:hypothetical protein
MLETSVILLQNQRVPSMGQQDELFFASLELRKEW